MIILNTEYYIYLHTYTQAASSNPSVDLHPIYHNHVQSYVEGGSYYVGETTSIRFLCVLSPAM